MRDLCRNFLRLAPSFSRTLGWALVLGLLAVLVTVPCMAQNNGRNTTPKILDLRAIPSAIDFDSSSCLVTFTLDDAEGDYVSWSVTLQNTGDNDLDSAGSISASSGTDASGTLVQLTFTAPSTLNALTVVLTVQATDGHGGWAAPRWIAIPVAPGGLGRGM